MIRYIDNKKIDLTDSEFKLYQEIAESYNTPRRNGADLFKGLFETDKDGIIIFLRPPNTTHSSLEIYLFLTSIFVQQHVRLSVTEHDAMLSEGKKAIAELQNAKEEYQQLIDKLKITTT